MFLDMLQICVEGLALYAVILVLLEVYFKPSGGWIKSILDHSKNVLAPIRYKVRLIGLPDEHLTSILVFLFILLWLDFFIIAVG